MLLIILGADLLLLSLTFPGMTLSDLTLPISCSYGILIISSIKCTWNELESGLMDQTSRSNHSASFMKAQSCALLVPRFLLSLRVRLCNL